VCLFILTILPLINVLDARHDHAWDLFHVLIIVSMSLSLCTEIMHKYIILKSSRYIYEKQKDNVCGDSRKALFAIFHNEYLKRSKREGARIKYEDKTSHLSPYPYSRHYFYFEMDIVRWESASVSFIHDHNPFISITIRLLILCCGIMYPFPECHTIKYILSLSVHIFVMLHLLRYSKNLIPSSFLYVQRTQKPDQIPKIMGADNYPDSSEIIPTNPAHTDNQELNTSNFPNQTIDFESVDHENYDGEFEENSLLPPFEFVDLEGDGI